MLKKTPKFDKVYYAKSANASIFADGTVIFYDDEPSDEALQGLHWFRDTRGNFQLLAPEEFTDEINM